MLAHAGSPRAPQALYAQADASLLAGQPAAAAERFSRYLELFPSGPLAGAALRRLPFLYLSMEEFASAAQWADAALEEGHAADLAARLLQVKGEAALQLGDPAGAVSELTAALAGGLDPGDTQRADYYLALAYLQTGQRASGLESLQDAGDGPDAGLAAGAVLNRAYLLIEDGALEEGRDRAGGLRGAVSQSSARDGGAAGSGADAGGAGGHGGGARRLGPAVAGGGGDDSTAMLASAGAGDVSMAGLLRVADAAVAVDQDTRALRVLADLRKLGSAPESLEAIYRIGRIYGTRGEHRRAADRSTGRSWTPARRGSSGGVPAWLWGAELYNAGAYEEALIYLRDGHGASVWEPYRHLALGRVYYRLRRSDEANTALAVAAQAPDAAVAVEASYLYAAAHYQGGRYDPARDAYLAFAERFPAAAQVPSAFYRAALSELRMDRPDQARDLLITALGTIESRESPRGDRERRRGRPAPGPAASTWRRRSCTCWWRARSLPAAPTRRGPPWRSCGSGRRPASWRRKRACGTGST